MQEVMAHIEALIKEQQSADPARREAIDKEIVDLIIKNQLSMADIMKLADDAGALQSIADKVR